MKIAVIGAGAIGGLVAGYLKSKGEDVSVVARPEAAKAIQEKGLAISGVRGDFDVAIDASERLDYNPGLAILCTKTQDIAAALEANRSFLKDTIILTTQNGVRADEIVSKYFAKDKIISSIVMFGSTMIAPAEIVHNFEGKWIIGSIFGANGARAEEIAKVLNHIFPVQLSDELKGMKYLKVFVNANNCIPAVLGKSMQECFSDIEISKISIGIWKEGLGIVQKSGIKLVSLPDFPLERMIQLASAPTEIAAKIYSGIMTNLSKAPLYGSILQSIKRGKASEIDYINGEFVHLAKENNLAAPLNEKLVEMVHEVEQSKKFFSKEDLLSRAKGLYN